MSEQDYINGMRSALTHMLAHVLKELGYDGSEGAATKWILEREAAISTLRRICEDYGDNDWPNDLHLSDIIEKHLERYFDTGDDE